MRRVVCASPLIAVIAVGVFVVTMSGQGMAAQGWYLVGPPEHRLPKNLYGGPQGSWSEVRTEVLKQLPLSEWSTYRAFDTAEACEAERESRIASGLRRLADTSRDPTGMGATIARNTLTYWSLAICIASDDVRLAPSK